VWSNADKSLRAIFMAQQERPLSPFMTYRWQYTNTLSILHRATGVFMVFGLPLLVYWLVAISAGADSYARALQVFANPLTKAACFLWVLSFMYHLLNGVRHLVWDMGYGFERAVARKSGWAVFIGSLVLTAITWAFVVSRLMSDVNVSGGQL
jgi:succinate dehydrogenase / fumarate reductase cytochrome b subunit